MIRLRMRSTDPAVEPDADDAFVDLDTTAESDAAEDVPNAEPAASGEEQEDGDTATTDVGTPERKSRWLRLFVYGVVPALALMLALAAGYLKWSDVNARDITVARAESVQAASDSAVALLSYRPDDVERVLTAAQDRMTGAFRESYAQLTKDVVIPGAKQQQITAVAAVRAAASVSAEPRHAVVLVMVNQTTTIGKDQPTDSASSVRVTLDKIGDRWLVSGFDPV